MRLSRREQGKKASAQAIAVILFHVADIKFAIDAAEVDEIRNLDGLAPLSSARAHPQLTKVKYSFQRQRTMYFAVDAGLHFGTSPATPTRIMVLRKSPVAVLVDKIDRMSELPPLRPLPAAFHGQEKKWYAGIGMRNEEVIPVVNPSAFLTKAEIMVLQRMMSVEPGNQMAAGAASA